MNGRRAALVVVALVGLLALPASVLAVSQTATVSYPGGGNGTVIAGPFTTGAGTDVAASITATYGSAMCVKLQQVVAGNWTTNTEYSDAGISGCWLWTGTGQVTLTRTWHAVAASSTRLLTENMGGWSGVSGTVTYDDGVTPTPTPTATPTATPAPTATPTPTPTPTPGGSVVISDFTGNAGDRLGLLEFTVLLSAGLSLFALGATAAGVWRRG